MLKVKCSKCDEEKLPGRRYCRFHFNEIKRAQAKFLKRTMYQNTCLACKNIFTAWKRQQEFCKECHKLMIKLSQESNATNNYVYASVKKYTHLHRFLAENALGRKLETNEVVHHVDCNHLNNDLNNLYVMDRRSHVSLHAYLNKKRVIFEK